MSTVTQENIGTLEDKLIVVLDKSDFQNDYDKSIKEYSKNAQRPGFSKGKVPVNIIKKMYGKSILADDLMRTSYVKVMDYVRENKLEIFANPMLVDMPEIVFEKNEPANSYTFEYEIGLRPEFTITLLDGTANYTRMVVETTDEMVDTEIDRMQLRTGEMTNPDTIEDTNTVLNVKMVEADKDGNPIQDKEPIDNSFLVNYLNENTQSQFIGKKLGETVTVQFSDAFSDKLLKAMAKDLSLDADNTEDTSKYFNITIEKIAFVKKSPLDPEFYDKIFPGRELKTEEEFKSAIKEDIQKQWDQASYQVLDNQLFEDLVHKTEIPLPVGFLKKWIQYRDEVPLTTEEVEAEYPSFEHQLRWTIISDKIIKENHIEVSREEVTEKIAYQIRSYFGMSAGMQEEWLNEFVDRSVNDKEQYEKAANEIMAQKVLAYARSKVNITDEKVTADEFNSRAEAMQHAHGH